MTYELDSFSHHLNRLLMYSRRKTVKRASPKLHDGFCCITSRPAKVTEIDLINIDGSYVRLSVNAALLSAYESTRFLKEG